MAQFMKLDAEPMGGGVGHYCPLKSATGTYYRYATNNKYHISFFIFQLKIKLQRLQLTLV